MEPLMTLTSHIAGKNATVRIFPDRVEWGRVGRLSTGAKAGLALATGGLSYFATGVRGKEEAEVIPIRSISHVGRRTHGFQDYVVINTAGGNVEMRVSKKEATQVVKLLNDLITQPGVPQVVVAAAPVAVEPVASGPSLEQLAQWHAQGVLSDEEFAAAKAKALGL